MHWWIYETQAKIKADKLVREADEWRRWKQTKPGKSSLTALKIWFSTLATRIGAHFQVGPSLRDLPLDDEQRERLAIDS